MARKGSRLMMKIDESGVMSPPRPVPISWATDFRIPALIVLGASVVSVSCADAGTAASIMITADVQMPGRVVNFRMLAGLLRCGVLELLQEVDQRLLLRGAQCPEAPHHLPRLAAVSLGGRAVVRRADDVLRGGAIRHIADAAAGRDRTPGARNVGRVGVIRGRKIVQ